jgi:hypothetical protein
MHSTAVERRKQLSPPPLLPFGFWFLFHVAAAVGDVVLYSDGVLLHRVSI